MICKQPYKFTVNTANLHSKDKKNIYTKQDVGEKAFKTLVQRYLNHNQNIIECKLAVSHFFYPIALLEGIHSFYANYPEITVTLN